MSKKSENLSARTADHVFILKTLIDKYCQSKNGRLYACFVDVHKVFDTSVIHVGLKLKLLKMNVGTMFYRIIANMYEHSRTCVRSVDLSLNHFLLS